MIVVNHVLPPSHSLQTTALSRVLLLPVSVSNEFFPVSGVVSAGRRVNSHPLARIKPIPEIYYINLNNERCNMRQLLHFPLTRILVGIVVCGFALLGSNSILRLVLRPEGDLWRVIRWLLAMLVLLATYYTLFKYYEKRAITELSAAGMLLQSLFGLLLGALCIALIILVLFALGYYEVLSTDRVSALGVLLIFFTTLSVFEEVIFRGIIYRISEQSLGTNLALLISALLFGLAHLPNEHANAVSVISAASGGLLAGLLFSLTQRLWLPIFFHVGWNWAQAALGVAVSGIEELPGFVQARLAGPEIITGGAFGPENSIFTVVLVLTLAGVVYSSILKKGCVLQRPDEETEVLAS